MDEYNGMHILETRVYEMEGLHRAKIQHQRID